MDLSKPSASIVVARINGPIQSRGLLRQIPDSDEVVDGGREGEQPRHAGEAPVPQLAHEPHRLQPAKDLFHELAVHFRVFDPEPYVVPADVREIGRLVHEILGDLGRDGPCGDTHRKAGVPAIGQ